MNLRNEIAPDNTSTPKRRRLGVGRNLSQNVIKVSNNLIGCCSIKLKPLTEKNQMERCESPNLPCNQIEYLCDSGNNTSTVSDIPCSPGILDSSVMKDLDKWESLVGSRTILKKPEQNENMHRILEEMEVLSEDMFQSQMEQSMGVKIMDLGQIKPGHPNTKSQNSTCQKASNCVEVLPKIDESYKESVQEYFDQINESICNFDHRNINKSSLFETRDSFLFEIKDSCLLDKAIINNNNQETAKAVNYNNFYGLPLIVQGLFNTYRNIEKFYDWQEECLNLPAIKERRNLIYALPTSGGKTLVAEVLMLREVLNRKKNALFILPFVAIVQEKIWSLSPFAIQLDFLVEEYAAGKGHIPPKKRRKKNSIYIATIEKALALVRSLIELDRLDEIGLIVVDELHLIGERGRGGTLETLLSTVIFTNENIQIVGMSATIGNLPEIAQFLHADVFERQFRPVELMEYVKLGDALHKISWSENGVDVQLDRVLAFDYSAAAVALDPDRLGGLVSEVVPNGSCLVFCPTKRNCENVALLLCRLQRREMTNHREEERASLETALRTEGASITLIQVVRFGVAYHHAGLASDERSLLEQAFRSGVISVLCCTSTLAAGVNLPAQRVIVRAPFVGREFISLAAYRQMVGRAGRAGVCDTGESIIICGAREWPQLRAIFRGRLSPARSVLQHSVNGLVLSAVALNLATTRVGVRRLLGNTLMAVPHADSEPVDIKLICDESIRSLINCEALEVRDKKCSLPDASYMKDDNCYVYNDSGLAVTKLGRAAIKGCMDLTTAKQLVGDLEVASRGVVLMGSLHLLYLVSPHDAAGVRPDCRHYYSLYCGLDREGIQTAKILGITEMNAIRMMTGKPITNVPEKVLCRFYLALMLHDLWKQVPFHVVAEKYLISRGTVQSVMTSAASFASCAHKFCEDMEEFWPFRCLFGELAVRLQHCAAPELQQLMQLPAVKKARALQLMRAGYKRVEDLAKASVEDLVSGVSHLSRSAANHLVSAARLMLIEKVENLRAEAEDVMEELNA
ncbi:hypothetical protein K1T71_004818 [Dendrolimus kikuchii]|uniref:Uncharacterized protein n=1 Tax=Dendrolimus kikuchii TaxID=765133 RepID=A0ACC1D5L6_9NEOP|nr:hypothetical protein K1T71_004818 [Dendrolimus kikuchii]